MDVLHNEKYKFLYEHNDLKENVALLVKGGSNAYHLSSDSSDFDLRGITVENEDAILGLHNVDVVTDKETDTTIYGLKKFIKLARKSNPNALELLFTDDEDVIYTSKIGRYLRDHRDVFLSKQILSPIMGITKNNKNRYLSLAVSSKLEKTVDEQERIKNLNKVYCETIRRLLTGICLARTGKFIVNTEKLVCDASLADVRIAHPFLQDLYKVKYASDDRYFDLDIIDQLEYCLKVNIETSNYLPDKVDLNAVNELQKECLRANLKRRKKIVAHQVNCLGMIGAGFDKYVWERLPECYMAYKQRCITNDPEELLGTCFLWNNEDYVIANIFGQYLCGHSRKTTNYDALESGLKKLREVYPLTDIIAPYMIGCNNGNGDWNVVKGILDKYNIQASDKIEL